jgi:hypothetical protein
MKKFIFSFITGLGLLTMSSFGATVTTVVLPNTYTNLLNGFAGQAWVTQVTVAANSTNVSALILDAPTNNLTYVLPAYTNITLYATNYYTTYTNYYGTIQTTYTNLAIAKVTNSIAQSTNFYPTRLAIAALASTSVQYTPPAGSIGYFFDNGIYATNNSSGIATITIQYR